MAFLQVSKKILPTFLSGSYIITSSIQNHQKTSKSIIHSGVNFLDLEIHRTKCLNSHNNVETIFTESATKIKEFGQKSVW